MFNIHWTSVRIVYMLNSDIKLVKEW